MNSVQRRFGKLLTRSADESQVAILLKDFDDADKMLARIIDASKAWRDSWRDILGTQQRLVHVFQEIYAPIIGADDTYSGHEPLNTPDSTMQRASKLKEGYDELRTDLLEEVNMVDVRILKPAMEAKDHIQPLKKVIKKREDRKLDYERYQSRVDGLMKKTKRSERENTNLAKAEIDLTRAKEEYSVADDHLRSSLPPLITAAFSLLPHLLSTQIMTQNALLGHYYTMLHEYCDEEGFPSQPPPMTEIISNWSADFKPVQREIETRIGAISGGKAVRQPLKTTDSNSLIVRNGKTQRRPSNHSDQLRIASSPAMSASSGPPSPDPHPKPKISSVPSQTSLSLATPNYSSTGASPSDAQGLAPAGPRPDYFTRERLPSNSSMASIAASKKPPPPPPPKRVPSAHGTWVEALYEFGGQGQGDLKFREGDRIRVVKKTDSTDDWWEGELKGVQGSFPANYVQTI